GGSRLVGRRSPIAQRRMQAPVIVIPHVAPEREAQLAIRCEPHAVDYLGLQRMKERLHMRVVPRGPPARSALPDTQDLEAIAEPLGGILAAAITVEDEAGTWAPAADGRIEHRSGEVCVAGPAEGPGEHPAGALVQHDGQEAPPPDDGHIRNVEGRGHRLHLHPPLTTQPHGGELELRTVFLNLLQTGPRHRTPGLLGRSVYKSEGGFPASFKRMLGSGATETELATAPN